MKIGIQTIIPNYISTPCAKTCKIALFHRNGKPPFRPCCFSKLPQKTSILKKMLHQNLCPGRLPAHYLPEPRPESNKISYTDVANPPYRHYTTNLRSFPIPHQASNPLTIFKTIRYGGNPIFPTFAPSDYFPQRRHGHGPETGNLRDSGNHRPGNPRLGKFEPFD